jgi:glycosyltransferase involved in cell wall biosynthesis
MTRDTLLVVSTSYPLTADGSEAAGAFVADFVSTLAAHCPVRVVGPGPVEGRDPQASHPTWRFSAGDRPLSLLSPARPWHWAAIGGSLASLRRQVFEADADGRVGHVLGLWALPSGWAARGLARRKGIPYSVWALGSDIWALGRYPIVRGLLGSVCREASLAFADGLKLAADAETISGRRFEFMPSCRRLEGRRAVPVRGGAPYRYLFLGRWHVNKGIDLLLAALETLSPSDWSHVGEIHIAGGGPLADGVNAGVARLRAAGRPVRLSGYLDRQEASAALAAADRLLLPSRIESIPVVFSDALAYGLPIVAMPVGDLPGLLADGGGWLAPSVDADGFAQALRASFGPSPPGFPAVLAERFDLGRVASALLPRLGLHGGSDD